MILSLEEDKEEFDLQDVTQNVITVDDEYLNGPMLARRLALRQPETVSVCSCTCYPGSSRDRKSKQMSAVAGSGGRRKKGKKSVKWWQRIWFKWTRSRNNFDENDDHFLDEETMSISNAKKNAIKRNSL